MTSNGKTRPRESRACLFRIMVRPASLRTEVELLDAFGSCLQSGDFIAALEAGLEVFDRFGKNADPGLLATLVSLLLQRRAPGDAERACAMSAALLADLPPQMRDRRHQMTYDYVGSLVETKQFAKAFETCDAIKAPTKRTGDEARELRREALLHLKHALEKASEPFKAKKREHLELAVAVCRELLKMRDGAVENLNLGAALCIGGDIEAGMRYYRVAEHKQDELRSEGGLDASTKLRLKKNLTLGQQQLDGTVPRDAKFANPQLVSGSAVLMHFEADGTPIGTPTVVTAPPPPPPSE